MPNIDWDVVFHCVVIICGTILAVAFHKIEYAAAALTVCLIVFLFRTFI